MNLVEGRDCLVGFRPEDFLPREALEERGRLTAFPFRVTRVEFLGADRLAYGVMEGQFPDSKVIAKLPSTVTVALQPAKTYESAVGEKELKFFDKATGLRTAPRAL